MKIIDGILEKIEETDIVDGILVIPEGVTEIKENACSRNNNIKEVRIADTVEKIGISAFQDCKQLQKITLPKNLKKIESLLFHNCYELKEINIPEQVEVIGKEAFSFCRNLKHIILPNSVTKIESMAFCFCKNLNDIQFSDNLSTIESLAFSNSGIKKLDSLPKLEFIGEGAFHDSKFLEKVILPNSLTRLEEGTFAACENLIEVNIPSGIGKIDSRMFEQCTKLKNVKIEDGISSIEETAFSRCLSLETFEMPDSVEKIGFRAFSECTALREIKLPKKLKKLDKFVFTHCASLTDVLLPEELETIECYAFDKCSSLKNINIPESLTKIAGGAFADCVNLKSINLPETLITMENNAFENCKKLEKVTISGKQLKLSILDRIRLRNRKLQKTEEIIKLYLYHYVNSVLRKKYKNKNEFLSNKAIQELVKTENNTIYGIDGLQKFRNLFLKLRKEYDINSKIFQGLSLKETEQFSYTIWNDIKKLFPISCEESVEISQAMVRIIKIFGLFTKDIDTNKRLEKLKKLFQAPITLTTENYIELIREGFSKEELDICFKKTNKIQYQLKEETEIPEEFKVYLHEFMTLEEIKLIKKQTGNYGKRINDFLKEYYLETEIEVYEQQKPIENTLLKRSLFTIDLENNLNYHNLHRIFDRETGEYDKEFYSFFIEYLPFILHDEKLQSRINEIKNQFPDMKNFYIQQANTDSISLKQAIDYINNIDLAFHAGNYELLMDAKKAGITDQTTFNYYQKIYEENQKRKLSSLVKRSNIYKIDGYTIKAELLRKDDSLPLFVGETNYTNCCQRYLGMGHNCMAHATSSPDGGIFVTKLLQDGEWILLTQSWDWQNNNLYCHDNIEATAYFKTASNALKQAVSKVYKLDAEHILEKSKNEIEEYVSTRRKNIEKSSLENKQEELAKLEDILKRQAIKVVTCGSSNDDLGLCNYFDKKIIVDNNVVSGNKKYSLTAFQPVNYNSSKPYFNSSFGAYSDAKYTQYILAGDILDLSVGEKELEPIYRDERRMVKEEKTAIRNYTKNRIFQMEKEVYDEEMQNHNSSEDLEDSIVYLGEDWYLVFEPKEEDNSIYISDLARIKPSLEDEKGSQQTEIKSSVDELINSYDYIEAELKEDTSYLLYLMNKRLGYIEQMGEDITYPYGEEEQTRLVTKEEQEEILKQIRKIREEKNPNMMMHKVKFKKK